MNLWPTNKEYLRGLVDSAIHNRIMRELHRHKAAPKRCEVTKSNHFWGVNYIDRDASHEMIAAGACSGFASQKSKARAKALSEWVERYAMKQAYQRDPKRFAHGSDGCAAYPVLMSRRKAVARARENALNEALERYVWAKWWDTPAIGHTIRRMDPQEMESYWSAINNIIEIESIYCVNPLVTTDGKHPASTLDILIARTRSGGILTGGAASPAESSADRRERAVSELLRHAIAFSRHSTINPKSFYEQRLVYFGSGAGSDLVESRLASGGTSAILLPDLAHDSEIDHPLKDLVVVYHCLFEGQPEFMGGRVERLCL